MSKTPQQLNIHYQLTKNRLIAGFLKGKTYAIEYPLAILKSVPKAVLTFVADNYLYSRTRPLGIVGKRLSYAFGRPALQSFIDDGLKGAMPCLADINGVSAKKLLADFVKAQKKGTVGFAAQQKASTPPRFKSKKKRAVLSLSFGKDSMLSYGLAKELSLDCLLVTVNEMEHASGDEWKIKSKIIRDFCREQKEKIHYFKDNIDEFWQHPVVRSRFKKGLGETNGLLAYALELLPFVYYHRARYLIFGNEQNMNDYYRTEEGLKFYPSYDQSSEYTTNENRYWKKYYRGSFQVVSLVEPLYNLAEMKILYSRYPHLLKYIMSCEPKKGSADRWCYYCPMCAKAFLYAAPFGDPKAIAFNKDFFSKKYADLYPLFSKKPLRHYERPPQVRDEQLLSFLMCYQSGWKGDLLDAFRKNHLAEAMRREKELRRKFFGIHKTPNVPTELKKRVLAIFHEELKDLQ